MNERDFNRDVVTQMGERFVALNRDVNPSFQLIGTLREYKRIIRRHCMKPRVFHTPHRIYSCMTLFDRYSAMVIEPNVILMAIFYRDLVIDAGSAGNQVNSAKSFQYAARHSLGIEDEVFVKSVVNMIRRSGHRAVDPPSSLDERLYGDICAAILGADALVYDRYVEALREEHRSIADDDWAFCRVTYFIDLLLECDHIYETDFFRREYEENARANLMQERTQLQ